MIVAGLNGLGYGSSNLKEFGIRSSSIASGEVNPSTEIVFDLSGW